MKLRVLAVIVLMVGFGIPLASANSVTFTNRGISSGNLSSGITSNANNLSVDGVAIAGPGFGTLTFDFGTFTGSLSQGGTFTGANFELDMSGAAIFATQFAGTWNKLGSGLYELAGKFSGVSSGVFYSGVTNQLFELNFNNHHICLDDVSGRTRVNVGTVPEPGTLTLLGTGLLALAGSLRRKLRHVSQV